MAFSALGREPLYLSVRQVATIDSWASNPTSIDDPKLRRFAEAWLACQE
ncbi:MAG: hypothetical protein KC591_07400 [Gemmatimonadetes bacterium]|nr:hypothetical protein [Gemmatimonadota bacterium]